MHQEEFDAIVKEYHEFMPAMVKQECKIVAAISGGAAQLHADRCMWVQQFREPVHLS